MRSSINQPAAGNPTSSSRTRAQTRAAAYRFGFNGQEKDDEVYGATGTSNTAEFWQYDTRTGRRWNMDPKPFANVGDYTCFDDNPIWHTDFLGDIVEHKRFKDKLNTTLGRIFNSSFRKDYRVLKNSEETYVFNGTRGDGKANNQGSFTTDGHKLYINYEYGRTGQQSGESSLAAMFHEKEHGIQFEHGEIGFAYLPDEQRWGNMNYDIYDEIGAHDAQYRKGIDKYSIPVEGLLGPNGVPIYDVFITNRGIYREAKTDQEKMEAIYKLSLDPTYRGLPTIRLNNSTNVRLQTTEFFARPYVKR